MKVYCVTKNNGPDYNIAHLKQLVYLGTSIDEAEQSVGDFSRYRKPEEKFPVNFREAYTVIPQILEPEMIQYYMADGWWYAIHMFELKETANGS